MPGAYNEKGRATIGTASGCALKQNQKAAAYLKKAAQKILRLRCREFATPVTQINNSLFGSFSSEKEHLS
jgi:hypothetical protein